MATENTGYQGWAILEGIYTDDNSLDGMKMPNVHNISPEAIVPESATITFNAGAPVTPSGGADGDIWYNAGPDDLYRNYAGTWTILNDTVINQYYVPPIQNLTTCPLS